MELRDGLHKQESLAQGGEKHPTFFVGRNPEKPHHIDYAFLSSGVSAKLTIGRHENWLAHSDHMPLILDVEPSAARWNPSVP